MAEKIHPKTLFEQRLERISLIQNERRALVGRIGYGEIKVGTDLDTTLRVGEIRKKVTESVGSMERTVLVVREKLGLLAKAEGYLQEIEKGKNGLAKISELHASGFINRNEIEVAQRRFDELNNKRNSSPAFSLAVSAMEKYLAPETKGVSTPEVAKTNNVVKDIAGKQVFKFDDGFETLGRTGKLFSLLATASADNPILKSDLVKAIYSDVSDPTNANSRVDSLLYTARKIARRHGLRIVNASTFEDDTRQREGCYFLRKVEKQAKRAEIGKPHEKDKYDKPEFGGLSRREIATIAGALNINRPDLEKIAGQFNLQIIDQTTVGKLVWLCENAEVVPGAADLHGQEQELKICQARRDALLSVSKLLRSDGFAALADRIHNLDPDVWAFLVNLSEIEKVRVKDTIGGNEYSGMEFLISLLCDPNAKKNGYTPILRLQPEIVAAPIVIAETARVEAESTFVVAMPSQPVLPSSVPQPLYKGPVIVVEPERPTKSRIEKRDPDVRKKLETYLNEVMSNDLFRNGPASFDQVSKGFSRLKARIMEIYVDHGWVSVEYEGKGKRPKFSPPAVATLLYLHDSRKLNLEPGEAKQVKNIAEEVHKSLLSGQGKGK